MAKRIHNTNISGGNWTTAEKLQVWSKGRVIEGFSADDWRRDICGHSMKFSEHGNRNSEYGWEIDHINPVANSGTDVIGNLQPLYWNHNAAKGDSLDWKCPVLAPKMK